MDDDVFTIVSIVSASKLHQLEQVQCAGFKISHYVIIRCLQFNLECFFCTTPTFCKLRNGFSVDGLLNVIVCQVNWD